MKNILQGIRNKNEQNLIKKILQYQNLPKEDQSRQKLTDILVYHLKDIPFFQQFFRSLPKVHSDNKINQISQLVSEKINIEVLQEGHIIQQQEEVDPKKLHYIISGSVAEVVKDISDDSIKKSNKRKKKSCLNYEMKDLVQNIEQMGNNLRKIIDRNGYYMHSLNPGQGFGIQSISTKKNPLNKSTLIVEKNNSIFLTLTNHDCEKVLEEFLLILKAKENFLKNSIPNIEQLSQQPIFQTICESFQVQEFKKGQFLTKQNHLGEFLYLVLEGEVKISKELELDHLVHQDKQKSSVQLSLVSQNQNSKSSIFIGDEIFFKKNFELIAKDLNKFTDKKDFLTPANSLLHDQLIQKFQKKNNIKINQSQKNYIEFEIKPKINQENKKNIQTSKDPKDQKTIKKQQKTQEKLDKLDKIPQNQDQNQPKILNSNRSQTINPENPQKNESPKEKKTQINEKNNNNQYNNNNNNNQYNNNNNNNNKNNQSDQEKGKKEEDSIKKLIEQALLSQNLPSGFNFKSKGQSFYDYTAQALTDVKVYFIKKYNFFEIFRRDSEFLEKMMEKLYIIFKAKTQKRQEKIDYHIKLIQKPEQINLDRKIIGFDHGKGYEVLKGMNKHSKKNIERENLLKTLQTFDYEKIQEESNKNQNKYMVGQKLQKLLDFIEYVNKNQDIFQINLNPKDIKQGKNDEISEQSDEEEDDDDEDEELEESDSDEQNNDKKKILKKNKKKIQNKGIIKKEDVQKQIQKQLRKKNKEEQKKIQIDNEEEEEDEAQKNNQDPQKLQKKKIKELEKQRFNDFKSFIIKVEKEKYLNNNNNINEDNGEDNWQPPKFCRKLNLEAVSNYDQSNFKLFNDLMNDLVSKEIAINKQQNQRVVDFSNKKVKNKYEVMNILHEFLTKKSKIGSNQGIGIIDFEDQQTKKDNYYKLIQRRMIEMPVLFQWKQDKTRLQKEKQIIEKFNKREIKKNKEYLAYHQQSIGSIDYKMLLQLSEFQDSTQYKKIGAPFTMQSIEPRYIEIQNIKIPKEHSVSQIIVLPDMNGMGFRYDTYSPKLIGLVSEEQFRETVRNATFLCQKMYTNDQKKQAQDPFALQKKILIFLIPFTLISMILYILRIYIDELKNNNGLIYSATILQAIVILGVFYAFITSMISKFEPINIEQKIQNELMSFFIEENKKPVFKQNCVRWEVPPRFLWLEITIDFERNGKKPYMSQDQYLYLQQKQQSYQSLQQDQQKQLSTQNLNPNLAASSSSDKKQNFQTPQLNSNNNLSPDFKPNNQLTKLKPRKSQNLLQIQKQSQNSDRPLINIIDQNNNETDSEQN